jgi:hypothetical protein
MSDRPKENSRGEVSSSPFDDLPDKKGGKRETHLAPIATGLRILSALALAFAVASAGRVILLDIGSWLRPGEAWNGNSALPLIGIGVSYALLQITLPCTRMELCLSLAVSAAFILWGLERYLPVRIAPRVDDVVVFLFVLDLGIVILGRLRRSVEKGE